MDKNNYLLSEKESSINAFLKFIAKVPMGYKVNVTDKTYVSDLSLIGAIKRKYLGENRNTTHEEIQSNISEALNMLPNLNEHWKMKLSIESLWNCKKGLYNLKNTYKHDTYISGKYDLLIQMVDNAIEDVTKKDDKLHDFILSLK